MIMRKLVNDLLKTPTGKFSRKSIMIIFTFIFTLFLGAFIVLSDKILEREVNRYAIDVFDSLLIFLGMLTGVTIVDKKLANKVDPPPEE